MFVKICANTNLGDALHAAEMGADAVGFVFAPSKRQVTVEQVAAITPHLPVETLRVGVVSSRDAAEILRIAEGAGLDGVQLHSAYDAGLIGALSERSGGRMALIQVVAIDVDADYGSESVAGTLLSRLEEAFRDARLRAVLLDAAKSGASGGLGRSFPWSEVGLILRKARERVASDHEGGGARMPSVILAGGLRATNVAEAIEALQPTGVDVASGVEAAPGRKNPEQVTAFLRAARGGL